jgi:putative transposase
MQIDYSGSCCHRFGRVGATAFISFDLKQLCAGIGKVSDTTGAGRAVHADDHVKDTIALDFFTVPTATFRILFVLVILSHDRRRIVHVNVTEHPTAAWTAQQLLEACGLDEEPRYLLRDRDAIYGEEFRRRAAALEIKEVMTAARSPWQNQYVERVIGSIRRECLDHIIILGERHLKRVLSSYVTYYHGARTHLSLVKDAPDGREVQPIEKGRVVELKRVGGLHHLYARMPA